MDNLPQEKATTFVAPPIIPPLIHRHAGDAAFYWQQHDGSVHSPLVGLSQLLEFDRLLDAHLGGLRVPVSPHWSCQSWVKSFSRA